MHAIKQRKRVIAGFAGLALGIGILFALAAEAALAPGTAFESIVLHSVEADFGVDPGFRIKPLNFQIVAEALNDTGHGRRVQLIPAVPPILRSGLLPSATNTPPSVLPPIPSASPTPSPSTSPGPKPTPTPSASPTPTTTPKTPPGQSGRTIIVPAGTTRSSIVTSGNVVIYGTVNGSVVDSGGNVTVYGTVTYDVTVFGANVTIYGTVGHDVTVYTGNVTVESTGRVGHNVTVSGGKVTRYPGSYVGGTITVH